MPRRVAQKWRPPLALVLGGTLAAVFALPLLGVGYFRLAGGVLGWAETSWLILWIAFITTALLGYLLWRLVLRPVRRLTAYAKTVKDVGQDADFPHQTGTPELSELADAVATMAATLKGREQVVRSYADHVTHEMKSPLSAMNGALELLDDPDLSTEDRARLMRHLRRGVARVETLLDDQRAFARASEPSAPGRVRLSEIAGRFPDVVVAVDGIVPLSAEVLEVVLTQLLGNAKEAGARVVTASVEEGVLRFSDDGPGISPGNRARIFEPFFTTRRESGGTGMGLPIVRRMLEAQGAEIALGDGSEFVIRW